MSVFQMMIDAIEYEMVCATQACPETPEGVVIGYGLSA
jgi:hypothetical protein